MRLALLLALAPVYAQQYEVASMRPSPPDKIDAVEIGIHIDGAFVRCKSLSLRDYIRHAFQVKQYQISGPEWMKDLKFDVNAKLPDGAPRADEPRMMQALLE